MQAAQAFFACDKNEMLAANFLFENAESLREEADEGVAPVRGSSTGGFRPVPRPGPTAPPSVVPQPGPSVAPQPAPSVVPQPAPNVAPQPAPSVAPQPDTSVAPQPAPSVVPQPAPAEVKKEEGIISYLK